VDLETAVYLMKLVEWRMRKKLGMLAVYRRVSSECETEDRNCEDIDAEEDNGKCEQSKTGECE
jgi:hypothetical protein